MGRLQINHHFSKTEKGPLNMLGYVYLGQPYSHPDPDVRSGRYHHAIRFVRERLIRQSSLTIYSPIIHYHAVALAGDLPTDADFWFNHNRKHALWCERFVGAASTGMAGISWVTKRNKPRTGKRYKAFLPHNA
jgi:hypothetical protein